MHGPKTRGLGDLSAGGGGGGGTALTWTGAPAINGTLTADFQDAAVDLTTHSIQISMYSTAGTAILGPADWAVAAGVVTLLKRWEISGFSQTYKTTDRVSITLAPLTAGVVVS